MNRSIIGLACSALIATTAIADDSLEAFKIYEQFVVSSAAASRCIQPPPEELEKFTANLKVVGTMVGNELQRRNPDATKEQLLATMNRRAQDLTTQTLDMVKEHGCDNKDVQQVVQRFHAQAAWKPAPASKPAETAR